MNTRVIHDVLQGTGPWLRLREGRLTASEAPAMFGVSKYVTRAELLRRKHTGIQEEHSGATLGKFAAGHAAEAKARPLSEEIAGGELFPVTVSLDIDGLPLLASLDGLSLDESVAWESKLWNEELAEHVRARTLPAHYTVQMDQALLVTGAQRCLFTCTDGTPERFVWCWYERDESKFAALLAGWHQFLKDLESYVLPEATEPAAVGKAPDTLPALRIEVTGQVTASNLAEFKETALAAIRSVNRELSTDQHFADAEKAVKWCAEVEDRLKAAKEHALSQTASIDALFKTIDDISAEARRVRLDLDKLVARRKTEVKEEAVTRARRALDMHIAVVHAEIAPFRLPTVAVDFAGAIKGLRSFDSMQQALDTTLTNAKIAADNVARGIRANVATFKDKADGFEFLFADLGQIVHKPADDFALQVQARIDAHKVAEAERERKAKEARDAEAARQAAAVVAAAAATPAPVVVAPAVTAAAPVRAVAPAAAPRADEPATLKLGTICDRLGFTMTSAFVADTLGIKPTKVEGASKLYRASDFARICAALQRHIESVYEGVAA
jgi:predicted phage-related endonuclease